MLHKKKRKHGLPPVEVNIVSLMDILTTLLFFILMAMSFSNFSIMEAEALLAGKPSDQKKNVFALRVVINSPRYATIQLGPIEGLKVPNKGWFYAYLNRNYSGNPKVGYFRKLYAKDINKLMSKVQNILKSIKKGFPHEHKVVVAFRDRIKYQDMIQAMNEVQTLPDFKEAFEITTLIGTKEKTRVLFPSVVLAEASSDKKK